MCTSRVLGIYRDERRGLDSLRTGVRIDVSHHWVLRTEPWVLLTAHALNH